MFKKNEYIMKNRLVNKCLFGLIIFPFCFYCLLLVCNADLYIESEHKIVASLSTLSTYTDAQNNLNNFYSVLDEKEDYLYQTNMFLCTGNNLNCQISSKYNDIGLINVDEYQKIGGRESYLGSTISFFSMTEQNNLVSNIKNDEIENVSFDSKSGLRGVVYVQNDVRVTGNGSFDDPFIFVPKGDINVVAWKLDGIIQNSSFPLKNSGYLGKNVTCSNGVVGSWNNEKWRLELKNVVNKTNCIVDFVEGGLTFYDKILIDNEDVEVRTDFNKAYTEENTGKIFVVDGAWTEDGGEVYYFAGNALNNWVKFGKDSEGNELYWRIIRTNEDGGIRLLYSGISPDTNNAYIDLSSFNEEGNDAKFVGYMYGISGGLDNLRKNTYDSDIKVKIDNWYKNGLYIEKDNKGNSFDNYISKTAIYCNDRANYSQYVNEYYFAPMYRLNINKYPSYKCGNNYDGFLYSDADVADKFSVSTDEGGNGQLTYPIGLMTADEVAFAGGNAWTNLSANWFYYNSVGSSITGTAWWWTMTPYAVHSNGISSVYIVAGSYSPGYLRSAYVTDYDSLSDSQYSQSGSIRPVISLKACVQYNSGDGSSNNPYTVILSEECANVENDIVSLNKVRLSVSVNDLNMASVISPSSVTLNNGDSYTFKFDVNSGYGYESVSGCSGVYDVKNNYLTVNNVTENTTCVVKFRQLKPLYQEILANNPNVSTRTDFDSAFTLSNNGNTIYKASGQDNKNTYYFAGNVTNNYVVFGGFYWRIVRINEDNSVRLIYAGVFADDTNAFIDSGPYNSSSAYSSDVGYMYTRGAQFGTSLNSNAKSLVDNWYEIYLDNYTDYISKTAVYCNDRTTNGIWADTRYVFYYAAAEREVPTFVCSNVNDRFTASTSTGNGKLRYPIALLSADEAYFAGISMQSQANTSFYLSQNAKNGDDDYRVWYTMTPFIYMGTDAFVYMISSGDEENAGKIEIPGLIFDYSIRPVISLKSCVLSLYGDGTKNNPYLVSLSSNCANLDN